MINVKYVCLVYQKDFIEKENDRYFLYEDGAFFEVESSYIITLECFIVTHDFWLISNSLYKKHDKLPKKIIDVVLLSKIVAGIKSIDGDIQPWDISKTIKPLYGNKKDFEDYVNMYYRRKTLDKNVYMLFSHKISEYFDLLFTISQTTGEFDRFFALELPLYNKLISSACKGIRLSEEKVRFHKEQLKLDFYRELQSFAEKHNVLYDMPIEGEIIEKLIKLGYDVENYSLDFLIDFLPSRNQYTDDLKHLQKTNKSLLIFNSISLSKKRLTPIVESHWTSTARVYYKSPSIQNLSKRYRDIFIPDEGMQLCYVDYDQFEVGVMAAISADPKMKDLYENTDAYTDLAEQIFKDANFRKKAKVLFLSYTYGMSLDNLISSVTQLGGDCAKAKKYFSEFAVFEKWKNSIYDEFRSTGRIGTICANYLNRQNNNDLSTKEQRTAVNHIIQGSATYIFKKAMLELSNCEDVQILIPMHDAVFFQHSAKFDPKQAVDIFEKTMTRILNADINGKASQEYFFQPKD